MFFWIFECFVCLYWQSPHNDDIQKHIRILFMEHSYDRRRCYEPHVLSPLRVHRISSTDNTLKPLIYLNMYVFCDVSSRIYNIIILHAFLCVPKVQLFWLTYFLLFPQQILSFVFAFYKLYAMKRRHNHQFIYMLCAGMA